MTELEKIERAKMYIDKLANGVNPIDNSPVADSDIVNNVRVSRCLFYVSEVLQQVIDNNGIRKKATKKPPRENFSITQEQISLYSFSDEPITVSEVAKRINEVADLNERQLKLKSKDINNALEEIGVLETVVIGGKNYRLPTEMGESIGVISKEREGMYGTYLSVLHTKESQRFIIDNIDTIVEICNSTKKNASKEPDVPWSDEEKVQLVNLYGDGLPLNKIAKTLNKSEGQVRKQLSEIGIRLPRL